MKRINELYNGYLQGSISDEEWRELLELIRNAKDQDLANLADEFLSMEVPEDLEYLNEDTERLLQRIKLRIDEAEPVVVPVRRFWPRIVAAAAILMVVGAGIMFYINKQGPAVKTNVAYVNDVAPGKMGATLTLSDGEKIRLSDAANGEIVEQEGITVEKSADGQLVYWVRHSGGDQGKLAYHTLSTAKGESYILILPDKSKNS